MRMQRGTLREGRPVQRLLQDCSLFFGERENSDVEFLHIYLGISSDRRSCKSFDPTGDYDQQVALCEALCRLTTRKSREDFVPQWFEDDTIAKAFKEINDREFETDCRRFINHLNDRLGDQRRSVTGTLSYFILVMGIIVHTWIGGNRAGPLLLSFQKRGKLWHEEAVEEEAEGEPFTVQLGEGKGEFETYPAETECPKNLDKTEMKMLKIYLKKPINIRNKEVTKIEIHFELQFNISQASIKALGEDKQVMPDQTKISAVFGELEKEDTEIPSSHKIETDQEKDSTKPAELTRAEDDHHLITLPLNNQSEPAQTNTADNSPKKSKLDDTQKEHEYSVDLQESSATIQFPTLNDASRKDSAFEDNRKQETRMSFDYRKHLFSESNQDSSSSGSELSWAGNRKRKSLKSYTSRKKTRTGRSSLRILPLFPPSSGSDLEKDQVKILTPLRKDSSRQNNVTPPKISGTEFQSSSAFLTPEDSAQKTELHSPSPLSDLSSLEHSDVEENESKTVAPESLMKSSTFKHKLQNVEDRDRADRHGAKWKQPWLEDGGEPGALSSVAEEAELAEGISTSSLNVLPENLKGSVMITAFENFTRELKRNYEIRYRRSPLYSKNAKEVPDCLIELLNQIHHRRLNKLEQFHSFVLQELSNLDKDFEVLQRLEDNVLEFWGKQSADLKSFCELQLQSKILRN
ncbi:hypothetical protein E5288_WYG019911 [Bos mutus]|uniref:Synaptonemal complex protein 2 Spt16M-like domain-containing protein n=1 Tax=Bos mutus TaxID=72004 RepID=A0A6B0RQ57_9CETA|nr:hypothetical protein [Bos mutus]